MLVLAISQSYAASSADIYLPGMNYLDFSINDINGKKVSLHDYIGKNIVLEWVDPGCNFVKKHYDSKKMQTLQKYYVSQHNVVWLQIALDDKNLDKNKFITAQLLDEDNVITNLYQIRRAPEVVIISSSGIISYVGAIDSLRTAVTADAWKAKQNYIESTLDALVSNQSVKVRKTRPYGCKVSANVRKTFRAV